MSLLPAASVDLLVGYGFGGIAYVKCAYRSADSVGQGCIESLPPVAFVGLLMIYGKGCVVYLWGLTAFLEILCVGAVLASGFAIVVGVGRCCVSVGADSLQILRVGAVP